MDDSSTRRQEPAALIRRVALLCLPALATPSCRDPMTEEQAPPLSGDCTPSGTLPGALTECSNWITFAPARPFDPRLGVPVPEDSLRAQLRQLYDDGWRGLVTYSLDPVQGLDRLPALAREVGFPMLIAGLFWFNDDQLARERTVAIRDAALIDAFVLGSEGVSEHPSLVGRDP